MNLCHSLRISGKTGWRGLTTRVWPLCQEFTAPSEEVELLDTKKDEDVIEQKRNKSRLRSHHHRRLHNKPPPEMTEAKAYMFSLEYQRKLYGHYGAASGVSPGLLWPSKEEMALDKERERVMFPHSIQEMMSLASEQKEAQAQQIAQRQEDIKKKVAKLETWKREVRDRIVKKERDVLEAQERKQRQIEEVRQILGFRIDPRDERFKEALEQKEKEEKKASKVAKKLAKQQRMIEKVKLEAAKSKEATAPAGNDGGDGSQTSGS